MANSRLTRGASLMIGAALCFAAMSACVKLSAGNVPLVQLVFIRAIINALVVIPPILYLREALWGKHQGVLLFRGTVGSAALYCNYFAVAHTRLADAAVLFQTSVFFVAILAAIYLRERVHARVWLLILAGLVGASLIIKPSFASINIGSLAALSSGFLSAAAYTSVRHLHDKEHPLTVVLSFSIYLGILSLLAGWSDFVPLRWQDIPVVLGVGLAGSLGQVLLTTSLQCAPASLVAPFNYSGVIFAGLIGWAWWGEIPDVVSITGMVLVCIAGIGVIRLRESPP